MNREDFMALQGEFPLDMVERMLQLILPKEVLENYDVESSNFCYHLSLRFTLNLKKCEIKNSNIHDRGVFSTKNIKKGELITMYPGDIIMPYPDGRGKKGEQVRYGIVNSQSLPKKLHISNNTDPNLKHLLYYAFDLSDNLSIIGHPKMIQDTSYLGHMINDICNEGKNETKYNQSLSKCNVAGKGICNGRYLAIIALKNIKQGEELLMSYGFKYWEWFNN
jgi:hypothetical protein